MAAISDEVLHNGLLEGPARIAVIDEHGAWTWSQLASAIERASDALRSLGVRPRDRLHYQASDSTLHQVLMLACAEIGAIFVPVNTRYTQPELARAVRLTTPTIALTSADRAHGYTLVGGTLSDEKFPVGALSIVQFATHTPPASRLGRTPWIITLSSGTSGDPKPVLLSLEGELDTVRMFGRMWRLNGADTVLGPLPFAWIYGLSSVHLSALFAGSSSVIVPRFSPQLVYNALEQSPVTVIFGTTSQFRILLDYARKTGRALTSDSIRMAVCGGERRNERIFDEFARTIDAPVYDLYAASEVRPVTGYDPLVDPAPPANRSGRVFAGVDIELRNELMGDREVRIVYARSPGNYMGYFSSDTIVDHEVTASDWVRVGDEFALDSNGLGQVLDRESSLIIRGGVNISPVEIEHVLIAHPAVVDAVVVGVPDEDFGESVVAGVIVANQQDVEDAQLEAHCESALAPYKVPRSWVRLAELPRNANDKVDRRLFRDIAIQAVTGSQGRDTRLTGDHEEKESNK